MGMDVYTYIGPIVYLQTVEFHLPHRAIRQRGFIQEIPAPFYLVTDAASHLRRHKKLTQTLYQEAIGTWDSRRDHRYAGSLGDRVPNMPPDSAYWRWYLERTPTFMRDPFGERSTGYVGSADTATAAVCMFY
jgi:hypothetical protein